MEPGFGPLDQRLLLTGAGPAPPDAGERQAVGVADDDAGVHLLDGPGLREAARLRH
jgi:hypothetical protein